MNKLRILGCMDYVSLDAVSASPDSNYLRIFRVQHTRTYKCKVNVFMGAVQKH